MPAIYVQLQSAFLYLLTTARRPSRDERGQASAEYALVLLGAAAIALLVVAWATKSDAIGKLFDGVMNVILGKAK